MAQDRVELLAERVANGLDIWSGKPLEGIDADDWVRNQDEAFEVERVLSPQEADEVAKAIEFLAWSPVLVRRANARTEPRLKSFDKTLGKFDKE